MIARTTVALVVLAAAAQATVAVNWAAKVRTATVADTTVSYRGIKEACVPCESGREIARYKVIHLKPDLTRTEYYAPKSVAGILIIRRGASVVKYSPATRTWDRMTVPPAQATQMTILPLQGGVYSMDGTVAIAGRSAYVVTVRSKTSGGLVQRFWIDKHSNLILATELKTTQGEILGYSRFTSVAVEPGDIDKSVFRQPSQLSKTAKRPSFKIAVPKYLPHGFRLSGVGSMMADAQPVVHLQFSDGSRAISLFQRHTNRVLALSETKSGASTILTWSASGTLFTLVGDINPSQLRKIATSMKP